MKNNTFRTLGLLALSAATIYACKPKKTVVEESKPNPDLVKQEPETAGRCSKTITYTAEVKKIIDDNCANSCHSAMKHAAGYDLSNYESLKSAAMGKRFMGTIRHESGFVAMPLRAVKMADSTITTIECWIENGMKE